MAEQTPSELMLPIFRKIADRHGCWASIKDGNVYFYPLSSCISEEDIAARLEKDDVDGLIGCAIEIMPAMILPT